MLLSTLYHFYSIKIDVKKEVGRVKKWGRRGQAEKARGNIPTVKTEAQVWAKY